MMMSLRGWEFDEMEGKSTATKKPNSYNSSIPSQIPNSAHNVNWSETIVGFWPLFTYRKPGILLADSLLKTRRLCLAWMQLIYSCNLNRKKIN